MSDPNQIPGSDLPLVTSGPFDTFIGVDESTGALRRFPAPSAEGARGYATLANLQADLAPTPGTLAYVVHDPVLANNGLYRKSGASGTGEWVLSADRVTVLEGDVAQVESEVGKLPTGLKIYDEVPGFITLAVAPDGYSRVLETSVRGELERFPNATLSSVGSGAAVLSGTSSIRSIVGVAGVGAYVSGDTVVIDGNGGSSDPPTEFVVCLVIGQSNNTTEGGDAGAATPIPAGVAYEYRDTEASLLDLSSHPSAQRATVMPGMALEFWKRTGLGVIFVNSAFGSSAMAAAASPDGLPNRNWDTTGTLRALAITRLNAARAMATAEGLNWQNGWVSWSQGEQDGLQINNSVITIADYEAAFSGFIDYLHANVGAKVPFIITRTSYRTTDSTGYQQIRSAQMDFAAEIDGVYMGYTGTMRFFADGLMADSVHYNQAGKNEVGKRIGAVAAVLAAGVN